MKPVLTMMGLCLVVCAVLWASGITPSQIAASQLGTWTVQPGNTPNITAWLVTATQSGSWTVQAVQSGTWTVTGAGGTFPATQSGSWNVGQSGAPWSQNLTQLNSVGLGSPSAYGSSPGAVNVPGVNAFVTNTPAVSQSGGPWTQNVTQWNSAALGSPSNYGTSPGAVAVPGVNAFVTNTPAVSQSGAPWSQNLTQLNSVGLGSPSAYGSSPGAVNVPGVNAFITNTAAVTLPVSLTSATQSTASTNATSVKGSAGNVFGISAFNTTTTIYYLRMYNTSSAPTCSSATGFVETLPVPPAGATGGAGGFTRPQVQGQSYSTGVSFCITGGGTSTDNTNAAVGVFVTVLYN